MEATKLDRLISIERAVITTDPFGGDSYVWSELAEVWAEVKPISDGERWRAAQVLASVTTRFRIRWGAGVKVTDRIIYDGLVYDIAAVKEIGRREGQEITAAARADEQAADSP